MKTTLEVCLYSGMCMYDPRIELSEEIRNILLEKIQSLDGPPPLATHHGMRLGPNMFTVVFWDYMAIPLDANSFTTPIDPNLMPEIPCIFATPHIITVSKRDGSWASYADTQGIHKLLEELAAPILAKHNSDYMAYYDEEMFRIP
jgi:hypothetical protein